MRLSHFHTETFSESLSKSLLVRFRLFETFLVSFKNLHAMSSCIFFNQSEAPFKIYHLNILVKFSFCIDDLCQIESGHITQSYIHDHLIFVEDLYKYALYFHNSGRCGCYFSSNPVEMGEIIFILSLSKTVLLFSQLITLNFL